MNNYGGGSNAGNDGGNDRRDRGGDRARENQKWRSQQLPWRLFVVALICVVGVTTILDSSGSLTIMNFFVPFIVMFNATRILTRLGLMGGYKDDFWGMDRKQIQLKR